MESTEHHMKGQEKAHKESYTLPSWRVFEIIKTALLVLKRFDFRKPGFDYMEIFKKEGIKIKKYSAISPENMEEFKKISLSGWDEGMCLVFPANNQTCKMIAYNDEVDEQRKMYILFHEHGHIVLKHTEQSVNGEHEAICYASALTVILQIAANASSNGELSWIQGLSEDYSKTA